MCAGGVLFLGGVWSIGICGAEGSGRSVCVRRGAGRERSACVDGPAEGERSVCGCGASASGLVMEAVSDGTGHDGAPWVFVAGT